MDSQEYIDYVYKELCAGKSIEAIGEELATVLNSGFERYQKEKEEENKRLVKKLELHKIIEEFYTWFDEYYGPVDKVNIERLVDLLLKVADSGTQFEKMFKTCECKCGNDQKEKDKGAQKDLDLGSFMDAVKLFLL